MKFFFIILILFYSFNSYAENKSFPHLNIGGISLYDNLFDYFTPKQIREKSKPYINYYAHLDKHNLLITIIIENHKNFNKKYESIEVNFKYEDGQPIIYHIRGIDGYDNINFCIEDAIKTSEYISSKYPHLKKNGPITTLHDADPTGESTITGFYFENKNGDVIQIGCYDWSDKLTKTNGWSDNLSYEINSNIYMLWLYNSL